MLARTDLNLGSALVCLLIGGVLLAIVWVIDRRQLRRQEAEATGRHAVVTLREDQRLARAERGVRDTAGLGDAEVPPVAAQDLEPTGEVPTRFIKVRPRRPASTAPAAPTRDDDADRIVVTPTPAAPTTAVATEPERKPEPVAVTEPAPRPEPEPEPEPEPVAVTEPAPRPEPVAVTEPAPRPEPEPEPELIAVTEPAPQPEPVAVTTEPAPSGPFVTFTAHAQGAKGVRFLDPAAVIDLTDEHAAVRPAPRRAPAASTPAAPPPVEPVEPAATTAAPPPAEGSAATIEPDVAPAVEVAPVEVAPVEVAPVEVAPVEVAPVEVAPVADAPGPTTPADTRSRRRRGRKGRADEPGKPKLPKGAEAALAAMVEVVPDPRNTVKTTRDPTAEVLLKKAERRAIEEAKAYRPPTADPVEWETPTEARVEATAPAPEHARADWSTSR